MPPLEIADHHDTIVVFDFLGADRYGEPRFANPREINVRWEGSSAEQLSPQETTKKYDAVIYTSEDLIIGSLVGYSDLANYDDLTEYFQVVNISTTKSLNARYTQRDAGLMRYALGRPEIAGS